MAIFDTAALKTGFDTCHNNIEFELIHVKQNEDIDSPTNIVNYWTVGIDGMIKSDFDQISSFSTNEDTQYGYSKNPLTNSLGVDAIFGEDHGAGATHLAIEINQYSPKQKRTVFNNHAEA